MEQMKKAYEELYDAIVGTKMESGLAAPRKEAEYTTFTAMKGYSYFDTVDKQGKPFRFMLVGRAVNGWDEYRKDEEAEFTMESFVESSILNLNNDEKTRSFGKDRFEWISTKGNVACNTARKGIDRGPVDGKYKLTKAQIWSYTKDIWDTLYGNRTNWSERWFEKIVWSNLYKIAPHEGTNPSDKEQQLQLKACISLLRAEIEYFKPTHIFLATGREYWFEKFESVFVDVMKRGTNISRGDNKNHEYVEATAKYRYGDGSEAKIVVACRPEGRPKEEYVKEVVSMFVDEECCTCNDSHLMRGTNKEIRNEFIGVLEPIKLIFGMDDVQVLYSTDMGIKDMGTYPYDAKKITQDTMEGVIYMDGEEYLFKVESMHQGVSLKRKKRNNEPKESIDYTGFYIHIR